MFKPLSTYHDRDDYLKLERRRQFEDNRKKRIFHARQRLFGLDIHTLNRQIHEKTRKENCQAQCERKWYEEMLRQEHVLQANELEQDQQQRVLKSQINEFRCRFQPFEQRREFDLNDPNFLKKQQPVRVADSDPNLGISSAQVFDGEDVGHSERRKRQCQQQRAWLEQQIAERHADNNARLKADSVMLNSLLDQEKKMNLITNSVNRVRNETVDAIRQYNLKMASQKCLERQHEKHAKWEDDMAEIFNMLSSDMLTENSNVAQSHTHPNKKVAYMYRGMTPEELKIFYREQGNQMKEMLKRRSDEKLRNKLWDQMAMNMEKELMLKQLEIDKQRTDKVNENLKTNMELAKLQQAQRQKAEKEKYNVISDDFYQQFNKSSR